jgi:hypothetical protein
MTEDTVTLEGLTGLESLLYQAANTVRRVRLEATEGLITTGEAAAMINHLAETINKATQ